MLGRKVRVHRLWCGYNGRLSRRRSARSVAPREMRMVHVIDPIRNLDMKMILG